MIAPDAQQMLAKLGLGVPLEVLVGPQLFTVRTIDVQPVSYTHLDVYKRQRLEFRQCLLFPLIVFFRIQLILTIILDIFKSYKNS